MKHQFEGGKEIAFCVLKLQINTSRNIKSEN